mgnify:FL=1
MCQESNLHPIKSVDTFAPRETPSELVRNLRRKRRRGGVRSSTFHPGRPTRIRLWTFARTPLVKSDVCVNIWWRPYFGNRVATVTHWQFFSYLCGARRKNSDPRGARPVPRILVILSSLIRIFYQEISGLLFAFPTLQVVCLSVLRQRYLPIVAVKLTENLIEWEVYEFKYV